MHALSPGHPMMARYRWRTRLRRLAPQALIFLFPKGRSDCGAHDFYRARGNVWRCYHCRPGREVRE